MNEPVKLTLWWEEVPESPGAVGRLNRLQLERDGATKTATKPRNARAIEARHLTGPAAPSSVNALKLYGLGVFALATDPAPHDVSRTMQVCAMPLASAEELAVALVRYGWIRS